MIRLIVILLALVSASVFADGSAKVVLVFKERVMVDGTEVHLGDIAEIRTDNDALRESLLQLKVGEAPRGGLKVLMRRKQAMAVAASAQPLADIEAKGSVQTFVQASTVRYSGEKVFTAAREYLSGYLKREHPELTHIDITTIGRMADLKVPRGKLVFSPRVQGHGEGKRVCVWVDVAVAGKPYRNIPVWLDVRSYAPVLVAVRSIKPKEPVVADDFAVEERNVAGLRGTAINDFADVVNRRSRTYIAAGAVLEADNLERAPSVLAEQEVAVQVALGTVRIETKAIAEEEGYVGEYVRVRNPASSSTFTARVVGKKAVLVTKR